MQDLQYCVCVRLCGYLPAQSCLCAVLKKQKKERKQHAARQGRHQGLENCCGDCLLHSFHWSFSFVVILLHAAAGWQHRQQQLTVVCDTPGWWQQSIVDKVERRQIQTQTQCRKSFMLKTDSTFLLYDLLLYMDCKFKNCLTRHCCISVQRSICSPRLI